jgi:N utilization substance protein A
MEAVEQHFRETHKENIIKPVEVSKVEKEPASGELVITIARKSDLGTAIGKKGANIEKARLLLRKFWGEEIGDLKWEKENE